MSLKLGLRLAPPSIVSGDGVLFSSDFFVSLTARLRENGWTDLHEIFREGVERPWDVRPDAILSQFGETA